MILKGKSAIVTGSTSGIGLAIAKAFAAEGASVTINGFGDAAAIETERAGLETLSGAKAYYSNADMMDPAAIEAMVKACSEATGGPDIIVNNAGIQHVAPIEDFPPVTDAQRIYLTGYRFAMSAVPDGGTVKQFLLFTSTTGGTSWTPMQLDTIVADQNSAIEIAGVSKTDPLTVYARVTIANGTVGDALYRSTNAGTTWKKILEKGDVLGAFVVRNNGDLVAGTPTLGAQVSHDKGDTWVPLTNPPHLFCLNENAQGELWACTQNFGTTQVPGDNFGIMKTTDLVTWTGVLRYQDIKAPVACPVGTQQKDVCEKTEWCIISKQLGITSTAIDCGPAVADLAGEAGAGDDTGKKKGCCDTGQGAGPGALVLGIAIAGVLIRPRRRR